MNVDMKDYIAYQEGYEAGKRDAASPWHRVENDAEFLSLIIAEICSYSVEKEMEPDDSLRTVAQNILKLLKISTFNNWMPIEPPKEEER